MPGQDDLPTVPEVSVGDLAPLVGEAVIVDVRQPDEYVSGHVPSARLIPLNQVPDRTAELPTAEAVFVICRTGSRSLVASEYLISQGVRAVNVAGGTLAWVDSGREMVLGDRPE